MTRQSARLLGGILLLASLLPALIGAGLIDRASALPPFNDEARAEELMNADLDVPGDGRLDAGLADKASEDWFRAMGEVRTAKWEIHDLGRGLLTLSACLLATWATARLWDARNLASARTPRSRGALLGLLSAAWLWPVLAVPLRIIEEQDRFYYPVWADSIGIPIFGNALFFLVTLPMALVLAWVLIRRATLPARLWAWRPGHPIRTTAGLLAASAALYEIGLVGWSAVAEGHHLLLPSVLALAYVVLSVRAAIALPGTGRAGVSSAI